MRRDQVDRKSKWNISHSSVYSCNDICVVMVSFKPEEVGLLDEGQVPYIIEVNTKNFPAWKHGDGKFVTIRHFAHGNVVISSSIYSISLKRNMAAISSALKPINIVDWRQLYIL